MKAREMFEELGYTYRTICYKGEIDEIEYVTKGKYDTQIRFNIRNKVFKAYYGMEENSAWLSIEHLQAINKQVEELGW